MSDLYDKQHDAEIVRLNDRITELEAEVHYLTNAGTIECMVRNKAVAEYIAGLESRLADAIEAQQVLGLKLEQAEADIARLRVDAERLSQYFSDEEDTYSAVGDYLDNAQPDIGDTFELTKCYAERKPTRFRVISRGLDITGEPIIDVEEVDEAKSHSANTVGGPTPVMDAAPACEPARSVSESIAAGHPCFDPDGPPDHDWEYVDDSFSHEFGTEICGHYECARCNAIKPE